MVSVLDKASSSMLNYDHQQRKQGRQMAIKTELNEIMAVDTDAILDKCRKYGDDLEWTTYQLMIHALADSATAHKFDSEYEIVPSLLDNEEVLRSLRILAGPRQRDSLSGRIEAEQLAKLGYMVAEIMQSLFTEIAETLVEEAAA